VNNTDNRSPVSHARPRIIIAINSAWNIYNYRAGLVKSMVNHGYDVIAVAPQDEYSDKLADLGCRYIQLPMDAQGTSPARCLLYLLRFIRLLQRERPAVYLGYTVKPNTFGSLAAKLMRIPVINNIAGLGIVFGTNGRLTGFVESLYRLSLSSSRKVFFQNRDDRAHFIEAGLVRPQSTELLPGSGVDLDKFRVAPLPQIGPDSRDDFRFLLIARMLWDKGVGEFVEAARQVKQQFPKVRFCLLGFLDVKNPAAISQEQINQWVSEGVIEYLGSTDDVRQEIEKVHCVVLPSYYREGTPRSLLESAAMGRPIITTDAVGCREVVDDGVNGYLCKPRDATDLADKMITMLGLSDKELAEMGGQGRMKMEREFDEELVIGKYLEAIDEILTSLT
jgi:glycosyltransferase involved in cell wall biosynthesis